MLDFRSILNSQQATLIGVLCMAAFAGLGMVSLKPLLVHANRPSFAEVATKGMRGADDDIGECIDLEAKKGFVFKSGVGDFWNARGLSYKTAQPLYILPITSNGDPFFHMMTLGPLIDPQKYRLRPYNFVVMHKQGASPSDITRDTLGRLLPPPTRVVGCANSNVDLWLYTDLGLDTLVRRKINHFLGQQGELRHYQLAGSDLPGIVGKVQSSSRVADEGIDLAGYLSYGPYITVPTGRYQVVISYTATQPGNKFDAGRFDKPENLKTVGAGAVPPGTGELKFSFETKQNIDSFEIRTFFGGRGNFAIHKIELATAGSK